ncbi:MAG: hypothetical protein R2713_23650 [Ilumatobacteraceae bacterium]
MGGCGGTPTWRVDLAGAGHQAISDIALYAELAAHASHLPDIVRQYLAASAADACVPDGRSWREQMQVQVAAAWAFLDTVLDLDAGGRRRWSPSSTRLTGVTPPSRHGCDRADGSVEPSSEGATTVRTSA